MKAKVYFNITAMEEDNSGAQYDYLNKCFFKKIKFKKRINISKIQRILINEIKSVYKECVDNYEYDEFEQGNWIEYPYGFYGFSVFGGAYIYIKGKKYSIFENKVFINHPYVNFDYPE